MSAASPTRSSAAPSPDGYAPRPGRAHTRSRIAGRVVTCAVAAAYRALPGGEALRAHINTIEDCTTQWQAVADYLTEEGRQLVGRAEADVAAAQIHELRLQLDRLDARVQRLWHPDTGSDA